MVVHHCQSKKIKIKINKRNQKQKKMKVYYSEKKLTKLHGPSVPSLIKNVFIQNEKKQNYHGP